MGMARRISTQVMVGRIAIGGGAPVAVQSMTNTDTRDVAATLAQIRALADAGCEILRCAVPDREAAAALAAGVVGDQRLEGNGCGWQEGEAAEKSERCFHGKRHSTLLVVL